MRHWPVQSDEQLLSEQCFASHRSPSPIGTDDFGINGWAYVYVFSRNDKNANMNDWLNQKFMNSYSAWI
jgi:hypothetical protein